MSRVLFVCLLIGATSRDRDVRLWETGQSYNSYRSEGNVYEKDANPRMLGSQSGSSSSSALKFRDSFKIEDRGPKRW